MTSPYVIIIMSLGVVAFSAAVMYIVWLFTSFLEPFWHGIIAFSAWIVAFACGSLLLWKGVNRLQFRGK